MNATRTAGQIGHTERGPRPLPPLAEQRVVVDSVTTDTVLGNGLRLLAVRMPSVPMVELRLSVPFAGSDAMHTATAEILAETLLTGTERRDRVAMDNDLALVGGELSTVVDSQRLSVSGSALASGFWQLLDVLADALTCATYREDEVERERARLVERIAVARAQPGVIAREALQRHRYGDHPFAREVPHASDAEVVALDDVRALHRSHVLPRGSTLVLVGDIDPEQAASDVQRALDGWASPEHAALLAPLPEITGSDLGFVDRAGAVQSQLRLSARAASRTDPQYAALQLANLAYAGYFSSRLVQNIREDKGYTYHARSSLEFTPSGATVLIETDVATEVTAAALLETRYELGRMTAVPPTESEVDTVRKYAIGTLATGTSSQAGRASQLSALAEVGLGAEWLREHPGRLEAVTAEQVAQAAGEFFAPAAYTGVVVGDRDALAAPLRALGGVRLP